MRKRISNRRAIVGFISVVVASSAAAAAWASELTATAEISGSTVTQVTVQQGGSTPFTIDVGVTGQAACGATSSAKVNTAYSLNAAGTPSAATPSPVMTFANPGGTTGNCVTVKTGAASSYEHSASISADENTPVDDYIVPITFTSITNSNATGGKLADATGQSITVHVVAPPPPADTTPPVITKTLDPASPNGENDWYTSPVTIDWTVTDNESTATVDSGCVDETVSADGEHTRSCSATSDGGSAGPVNASFKIDQTDPNVSVTGVSDGATYTLGSVPTAGCNTTDETSGVQTDATVSTSGGPVGSVTATCSGGEDNAGNVKPDVSVTYSVVFAWTGFFQPIDNGGVLNVAKAGSAIPVKFSLSGNQGLNILDGAPKAATFTCDAGAPGDPVETTVTAGNSSLSYDATADQYVYVWKTDKSFAGQCRQLQVKLVDGTVHTANFKFTK